MIPDLEILRRQNYQSGLNKSNYNPQTLIMRVIEDNIDNSAPDFFDKSFEFNATYIHERVHWLQHHGTTLGTFLEAARCSQEITTLRFLSDTDSDKIVKLLSDRVSKTKKILPLNSSSQYPIFDSSEEISGINVFRQIWFDHQWIHRTFEDSRICEQIGSPPSSAMGEVFADVMLALCAEMGFKPSNKDVILNNKFEVRKWFNLENSQISFVKIREMRLTTKMIMEAAATISEMQLFFVEAWRTALKPDGLEKALQQRYKTVIDSDYGIPIRSFLTILN